MGSTQAPTHIPRDVKAELNFFIPSPDGSLPEPIIMANVEAYHRERAKLPVTIHDIRGHEHKYDLATHGFEYIKHESKEKEFVNDEKIKDVYYSELKELLTKLTGSSDIFIYQHIVRRAAVLPGDKPSFKNPGPLRSVHIDSSPHGALCVINHYLPTLLPVLPPSTYPKPCPVPSTLPSRYRILSIWRPIRPILKDPLCVADTRSVLSEDLVPFKQIWEDWYSETYSVVHNEGQKWHYLDHQGTDEVLMLMCFDSQDAGCRVPHSSFVDEGRVGEATRESIEVRAVIFGCG